MTKDTTPDWVRRSHLSFVLNDDVISLSVLPQNTTTLLDYLRERQRLYGTKEGCAEGDCGACTVLVGRLLRGQLVYESVNACIRLLGTLHACHVVTVEYLSTPSTSDNHDVDVDLDTADAPASSHQTDSLSAAPRLHPLQQAMVDAHASQCGFCTPGIVMSLYALWLDNPVPSSADFDHAMQGNLCRCTGYRPIRDAIQQQLPASGARPAADRLLRTARTTAAQLRGIDAAVSTPDELPSSWCHQFSTQATPFLRPTDLEAACQALQHFPHATIVAGGTDVGLWITKHLSQPRVILGISHLDELHQVTHTEGVLTLGAATTYTEAWSSLVRHFPALEDYWWRIGGEQVRNMGTLGGNIANGSPIGDTPPVLIALGATLQLQSASGARELPVEDFFIDYGKQDRASNELVTSMRVPDLPADCLFSAYKVSKRADEDIATVSCAIRVEVLEGIVTSAVIAYGGMAATPKRARQAEQALTGELWSRAAVDAAMLALGSEFTPIDDARASATYRLRVAANLLLRFYLEHESDVPTQLQQLPRPSLTADS